MFRWGQVGEMLQLAAAAVAMEMDDCTQSLMSEVTGEHKGSRA